MNRKKSSLCYLFLAFLLGGVFVLTSCDKGNDVYNPNHIQEEAKKAFPVKNIDPNQTWEMSSICNASVSVNEKTGGAYTIKVYTENPYNTNGNAFLLAKTSVTDGQTVNFKFDIPAALQYVYVMKVNSEGYSSAIPVNIENGVMKAMFGESGTTRAIETKAYESQFFLPEAPGDKTFPITAPSNCGDINKYNENKEAIPYLLKDNTYDKIDPERGGDLYIQGNVTIKSWSQPGYITNFYLLPNATLTLEFDKFNHRPNSVFSIGSGAKLIAKDIQSETGSKYFNRGTIVSSNIQITNAYIYNEGTIETDLLLLTNSASKFCNAAGGVLTTSTLQVDGQGQFLNVTDGVVNCKGATNLTCTNGSWENAGHFTTDNMHCYANSKNLKNACWLTVTNELKLESTTIENESYIECNTLDMRNGTVKMAGKSLFVVKKEAKFGYNRAQGFIAPKTGEKAVLKMKRAIRETNTNDNMVYSGMLYIACNDHFPKEKDQWNPWYELENGAELSGEDNASIKIDKTPCNPGYNSTPDGNNNDKAQTYTYVFEDMMTEVGDYDFNDVVLYVTVPYDKDDKKVIDVTLKAAGATKQLTVLFKDNGTVQTIFEDVHNALGVSAGTITNTGSTTGVAITKTIEVRSDFNLTSHGDFYISDGKREIHIPNFTSNFQPGNAPYALRIATNWKWPKERIQITEAYPDFAGWVQDATIETSWHNKYVSDKVID